MLLLFKNLLFTVLIPGTVVVYQPRGSARPIPESEASLP